MCEQSKQTQTNLLHRSFVHDKMKKKKKYLISNGFTTAYGFFYLNEMFLKILMKQERFLKTDKLLLLSRSP